MAFFDFLKGKKEATIEIRRIPIDGLGGFIEDERNSYKKLKEETNLGVHSSTKTLISELKSKKSGLENAKIREKEDVKIKIIVRENLNFYLAHLDKLISELESLDLKESDYLDRISNVINKFQKNSKNNYEKATILVGKEIGSVQESIKRFVQEFGAITSERRISFEKQKIVNELDNLMKESEKNNSTIDEITRLITDLERKRKKAEAEENGKREELEKWRKSDEFILETREREKAAIEKERVRDEIFRIKEKIDIKELIKQNYKDEKKAGILKSYQENFISALENDSKMEFGIFVDGWAGKNLFELREKLLELSKEKESGMRVYEDSLKRASLEVSDICSHAEMEKKKVDKLREKSSELDTELRKKAEKLNISLV